MRPQLAFGSVALVALVAVVACGGNDQATGDGGGSGSGSNRDAQACVNTAGPALPAPTVVTGTTVKITKVAQK